MKQTCPNRLNIEPVIGGALDGARGAILGALLGPIGLIITAVMRAGDKKD